MIFKVSYIMIENNKHVTHLVKTLDSAQKLVSFLKKGNVGKDFKITPIKF